MRRRSSLGPFPKRHRLKDLFARDIDALVARLRQEVSQWPDDTRFHAAAFFFVALVVASRFQDPDEKLSELLGASPADDIRQTLAAFLGQAPSPAYQTLDRLLARPVTADLESGPNSWLVWTEFDGSAFCILAREFFADQLQALLRDCVQGEDILRETAWDLTRICASFSARWFHKCMKDQTPDAQSVRWYLRHCCGKLDLELSRELEEPTTEPSRRTASPEQATLPF